MHNSWVLTSTKIVIHYSAQHMGIAENHDFYHRLAHYSAYYLGIDFYYRQQPTTLHSTQVDIYHRQQPTTLHSTQVLTSTIDSSPLLCIGIDFYHTQCTVLDSFISLNNMIDLKGFIFPNKIILLPHLSPVFRNNDIASTCMFLW